MMVYVYYRTPDHGASIQETLNAAGIGTVSVCNPLTQLPSTPDSQADIVLLEYEEDNPALDAWIQQAVKEFHGPSVFLVFPHESTLHLLKALMLGVHGYFIFPLDEKELRETVEHVTAWDKIKTAVGLPDTSLSGG